MIRVLVLDSRPLLRDAIVSALAAEHDVDAVIEDPQDSCALELIARSRPDVVLVDADWSSEGSVRFCADLKAAEIPASVIVISDVPDQELLVEAVEAGADGYFDRTASLEQLVEAIRSVARGQAHIPAGMLGALLRGLITRRRAEDEALALFSRLSKREKEVLSLVAAGLDNAAIAEKLFISLHTARTHVQNVLEKLDVHSRLEASNFAIEHNLIDRFAEI